MKILKAAAALALCAALLLPAAAEGGRAGGAQALIERAVVSRAVTGERDAEALRELAQIDPDAGDKWERVMDIWDAPEVPCARLPDGLPGDGTLCLVVLGFQLAPDGSMREELVERLKVALEASRQYPNAVIVCTGGGTAELDPTATAAGRMAQWLAERGVDGGRLIVEDRSLTTAQNAVYTFDILERDRPGVRQIAVISSDYHIETGMLLFGAEAILRGSSVRVAGNASWHAPGGSLSDMFKAGALIELSGDRDTAFSIYYDTYDIHSLPDIGGAEGGRKDK